MYTVSFNVVCSITFLWFIITEMSKLIPFITHMLIIGDCVILSCSGTSGIASLGLKSVNVDPDAIVWLRGRELGRLPIGDIEKSIWLRSNSFLVGVTHGDISGVESCPETRFKLSLAEGTASCNKKRCATCNTQKLRAQAHSYAAHALQVMS